MNWKVTLIGGLAYYLALLVVSMVLGHFIHDPAAGVLAGAYRDTAAFWRPELMSNPPDMSLMWRLWIPSGLTAALIAAAVYSVVRSALTGPSWRRGLQFGLITIAFCVINALGYHGIFNLPDKIWVWWIAGSVMSNLVAGALLGVVAEKMAPAAR
ncbi:MAG: hypothetical protein FJ171_08145 [Gammaproteobacteria bacterium]|nr:hypothetical protein [Gammaproteobacteria bacterium]